MITLKHYAGRLVHFAKEVKILLPEGFEPSTQRFEDARSRPLSYGSVESIFVGSILQCKENAKS